MALANGGHVYSRSSQFIPFPSRRSVVHSAKGIVSCTQPLAASAGIRVLQQGGNAADAAVATAAAMNVTEPASTGIGGDMFCLFYSVKDKKTYALNGSGRSGSQVTLERMRKHLGLTDDERGTMPHSGIHSVTVPGAAAGWVDTVDRFGSGKLSLQDILAPAIELAEEGFPVHQISAKLWSTSEAKLRHESSNYAELLKRDRNATGGVRAPGFGELFSNPDLGRTFRLLAQHGKSGFYEGPVAESIAKISTELGGWLTPEDLKSHATKGSEPVEPISLKFDGPKSGEPIELWEHPPNGQGLVALLALGIIQELERTGAVPPFAEWLHNSTEYIHILVEALRLAFSDGCWYVADPSVSKVPVSSLLSPAYLASRASQFDPNHAIKITKPGSVSDNPAMTSTDTVYFSVTDPFGNACSFINSNFESFGSGVIPAGTGFALQNRGAHFVLGPPDHPNILAPNKRPYHTIIPAMVTSQKTGELHTCYGVMAGFMQPQGHVQVLLNMLVFGMNPQEALDAPRICLSGRDPVWERSASRDVVQVEEGISDEAVTGLKKLGHNVEVLDDWARSGTFGRGQVIRRHVEGDRTIWSAGSDMRGDGHACPM